MSGWTKKEAVSALDTIKKICKTVLDKNEICTDECPYYIKSFWCHCVFAEQNAEPYEFKRIYNHKEKLKKEDDDE